MAFRRNRDWVPCFNYGSNFAVIPPGQTFSAPESQLLVTPDLFDDTGADVEGVPDDRNNTITSLAVRGTVFLSLNTNPQGGTAEWARLDVFERIHVGLYDITTGAVALAVEDLWQGQSANERYLWARNSNWDITWSLGGTGADFSVPLNTPTHHPYFSTIEVQSERRINTGECLLYTVQCFPLTDDGGAWTTGDVILGVRPMLRTLVRK